MNNILKIILIFSLSGCSAIMYRPQNYSERCDNVPFLFPLADTSIVAVSTGSFLAAYESKSLEGRDAIMAYSIMAGSVYTISAVYGYIMSSKCLIDNYEHD